MSEHQVYEFVALDQPLTAKQMAELRAISTRAEITPSRFWNEYHWGDLKADPAKLLARYFDAFLYSSNWGTRRLMLRLPRQRVDLKALKAYFPGRSGPSLKVVGEYVVLDLPGDDDEPADEEVAPGSLAELLPLRAELLQGDLRSAYLVWLSFIQDTDAADDAEEPPVPPGLASLTAAQHALVDLLGLDSELLATAASKSAKPGGHIPGLRDWVRRLTPKQKEQRLLRAVAEPDLALGAELGRAFHASGMTGPRVARRTRGELRGIAHVRRLVKARKDESQAKRALSAAVRKHREYLDSLARDVEGAWARLEQLVSEREYDEAVRLAAGLDELATRQKRQEDFKVRFEALRKRQSRRRGFLERWNSRR